MLYYCHKAVLMSPHRSSFCFIMNKDIKKVWLALGIVFVLSALAYGSLYSRFSREVAILDNRILSIITAIKDAGVELELFANCKTLSGVEIEMRLNDIIKFGCDISKRTDL